MPIKPVILTSLSTLMKHSREFFKNKSEFNRVNFENSMRAIGQNLKFFIQEFRESFEKLNIDVNQQSLIELKQNETEILDKRRKDGRTVKVKKKFL
jgi:hypothetical protein